MDLSTKTTRFRPRSFTIELSTQIEELHGNSEIWDYFENMREGSSKKKRSLPRSTKATAHSAAKLDFHVKDSSAVPGNAGTNQLDMLMPEHFDAILSAGSPKHSRCLALEEWCHC